MTDTPRRGLPRKTDKAHQPSPRESPTAINQAPVAGDNGRRGLPRITGDVTTASASPPARVNDDGAAVGDREDGTQALPSLPISVPITSRGPQQSHNRVRKIFMAVGVLVLAVAVVLASRWFLFDTPPGTDFVKRFPGQTPLPGWAPTGFPLWLQWQHWLNAFFIILIIKSGWMVRTTRRPAATWRSKRRGIPISIELWIHLVMDVMWIVNGAAFVVLLFSTGQWIRVVPTSWAIIPNAGSALLQYLSMAWPTENGWVNYNSLQVIAYFLTIFVAAPLAAITGFRMSPFWPSRFGPITRAYPIQLARAIHYPVMIFFVLFILVHVTLVLATGAVRNLNHMFWGSDDASSWAGPLTCIVGLAVIAGAFFALRPTLMRRLAAAFGEVRR